MSSDWARRKAALAPASSPAVTASSNLRRKVRIRERRALLTSVRRAILRIAFLAPGVLAMVVSVLESDERRDPPGANGSGHILNRPGGVNVKPGEGRPTPRDFQAGARRAWGPRGR